MLHLLGPASRGHVGPKGMFRSVRVWVSSWPCEGFFTSEFKQTYALSLCRTQKGMQYVQTMRSIVVCSPQETHLKPTSLPKASIQAQNSLNFAQFGAILCWKYRVEVGCNDHCQVTVQSLYPGKVIWIETLHHLRENVLEYIYIYRSACWYWVDAVK